MFDHNSSEVISWFENREYVQNLLFSKNVWFHDDLELSDIENAFTSPIRSYRSGHITLSDALYQKLFHQKQLHVTMKMKNRLAWI